jgi:hypothetical protein
MNALSVFKFVAELSVSTGVAAIVSNASRGAVPRNAGLIKKASIGFGTFILSHMVAEQAVKYTNDKLEYGLTQIKDNKQTVADAMAQ